MACEPSRSNYSGFDSASNRKFDAQWHFPQPGPKRQVFAVWVEVNATLLDLQMSMCESKPL
jgi:hypothetical protein